MAYINGFKWGMIVGFFVTLFSLGYIIFVPAQAETVLISRFIRFDLFLAGLIITIVRTFRRKSIISPSADGFISGFGVSSGIIDVLVYGPPF